MREIKFRAWDKEEKVMRYVNQVEFMAKGLYLHTSEGRSGWVNIQFEPPMQFTGLKDKNGKEIYEGDVLAPGYSEGEVFEVVFSEGCFCERRRKLGIPPDALYIMDGSFLKYRKLEIIGNIYENPELLKGLPHAHDTT